MAPTAASGRMEANEPANITGANSSRVKMTICGPRMAVMMPPASTKEMARALNSGGALSAAAKRNCWTKAPPMPITSSAKANSQKLPWKSASVAIRPPSAVTTVPVMKPPRWPSQRMMAAAGKAPSATPMLKPVIGAVASDLSAPSRYWPASAPMEMAMGAAEPMIACEAARISAVRRASLPVSTAMAVTMRPCRAPRRAPGVTRGRARH